MLNGKNVLVTGGAGFIGSHLADRLIDERPNKIVIVDNLFLGKLKNLELAKKNFENIKFYDIDASSYDAMRVLMQDNKIDVVFNLAIVPLPASLIKPIWTHKKNISLTYTLCELARKSIFKELIHCSSSEVYGDAISIPMSERHALRGKTPYAASKSATDNLIYSYIKTFNISAKILRPFNNYGPRQNEGSYAGIIPITIKRILSGNSPIIYGDGMQTRDYIFVTDTADAFIKLYNCSEASNEIINIGSGLETPILNIVETLIKLLDCNKPIIFEKTRPGDVLRHVADISLAKERLNFKQQVGFEEGLKKTVEWYYENYK